MLSTARPIAYEHPGENTIFDKILKAEGLILFAHDAPLSNAEHQMLAVVAGGDGPKLICARTWQTASGTQSRIDVECLVDDACRRFLSTDTHPAASPLTPHTEVGIIKAYPGRLTEIWRSSTVGSGILHSIYLLRQPAGDDTVLILASDIVTNGTSTVVEHGRVLASQLKAWAHETFQVASTAASP